MTESRSRRPLTVVRDKGQVTIPAWIRQAAHLAEGDPLEVSLTRDGILLRPRKLVDTTQAWFWSESWQSGEREASGDIAAGRTRTYKSDKEFLKALDDVDK
jgi:AbrB family looped-hinge helix DNA binding protein